MPKLNVRESVALRGVLRCELRMSGHQPGIECQTGATGFLIKVVSWWEFCFRKANLVVAYGIILLLEIAGRKIICRSSVTIPDGKVKIPIMMAAPQTHHRQANFPDLSSIESLLWTHIFLTVKGCSWNPQISPYIVLVSAVFWSLSLCDSVGGP